MNVDYWMLIVPLLVILAIFVGLKNKAHPYDSFIEGIYEGAPLIKEIFPSLLAMVIATTLLRSSGLTNDLGEVLRRFIPYGDFLAELTPMAIFRPLSGSASMSVLNAICTTHGPDSLLCQTVSSIQGSTDTTFYVIALYFGTIGVKKWRHTLKAGLTADAIGIVVAIILSIIIFG
jgi:spore maturation protein B